MSAANSHSQPHFTSHDNKSPQATSAQSDPQREGETQELVPDRPPEPVPESKAEPGAKPRRPRGFAAMDRKLVSEIARKGGKAAHSAGTAHEFTTEEARVAGRKGGRATHAKRRARTGGETPPASEQGQGETPERSGE